MTYADCIDELIRCLALGAGHDCHDVETRAALYVLATIFYKRRVVALGMRS